MDEQKAKRRRSVYKLIFSGLISLLFCHLMRKAIYEALMWNNKKPLG